MGNYWPHSLNILWQIWNYFVDHANECSCFNSAISKYLTLLGLFVKQLFDRNQTAAVLSGLKIYLGLSWCLGCKLEWKRIQHSFKWEGHLRVFELGWYVIYEQKAYGYSKKIKTVKMKLQLQLLFIEWSLCVR